MKTKDSASRASALSGDPQAATGQPTDEEVICAFMEPKPKPEGIHITSVGWWVLRTGATWHGEGIDGVSCFVMPRELTLDALHEVEAKVLDIISLRENYYWQLAAVLFGGELWAEGVTEYLALLHATAEQKIKALAAVLRTQVTK